MIEIREMTKFSQKPHKVFRYGERGFTLIELLVVVAILGALAAVVILNGGGFIGRGVCEAYCTEHHNVQTAAVASGTENKSDCSKWPDYLSTPTKYDWSVGDDCIAECSNPPDGCDCKTVGP